MNAMSVLKQAILVPAICVLASCATSSAAHEPAAEPGNTIAASFPEELHGHWMPTDLACTTPVNYDSDVLVVIDRDRLTHYEDSNKPVAVRRLSTDPDTWSITSLLGLGGEANDILVSEVFMLSGRQLAVGSKGGIKSYQRCD